MRVNRGNHLELALLTAAVQAYRQCESARKSFIDFLQRGQIPPSSLLTLNAPVTLLYEGLKYAQSIHYCNHRIDISNSSSAVGTRTWY